MKLCKMYPFFALVLALTICIQSMYAMKIEQEATDDDYPAEIIVHINLEHEFQKITEEPLTELVKELASESEQIEGIEASASFSYSWKDLFGSAKKVTVEKLLEKVQEQLPENTKNAFQYFSNTTIEVFGTLSDNKGNERFIPLQPQDFVFNDHDTVINIANKNTELFNPGNIQLKPKPETKPNKKQKIE